MKILLRFNLQIIQTLSKHLKEKQLRCIKRNSLLFSDLSVGLIPSLKTLAGNVPLYHL